MPTRVVFLFGSVFMHILVLSIPPPDFELYDCSEDAGNYTNGSQYQSNLNAVLSSISNDVEDYGFYNKSSGQDPDTANAIALCRGDVSTDVCRGFIKNVTEKILEICPNQKQALGWCDECMLRYANQPIFGLRDTETYWQWDSSSEDVGDNLEEYQSNLQELLFNLTNKAVAEGDWRRKFASGRMSLASYKTIYALVQSTPDLRNVDCKYCLRMAIRRLLDCCQFSVGEKVADTNCNIRFSNQPFFKPTPESLAPPSKGKKDGTTRIIVIILVAIVSVKLLTILCLCIISRQKKQKNKDESK